ncbi:Phospholipase_D-nuclease N-terminal [Belliella buryatensis]|uniref:Phospholipase_D-nuclease N-terminal n=1 Tax=Belliella buryatensis TaxID=1500549 RepID=A0A239FU97_9BACT|nr:PLDc N-terminal domain-containing protein [Belliella buryatensis]SNS60365.1 Phospholipase_D-nuclease N-terminal [Belliella buryatensis]
MELIEPFGIQYWILALVVLYGVLWLWCLIDLIKSEFTDNSIKALWLLLLVFLNPLAPFLYGHFARKQKLRTR